MKPVYLESSSGHDGIDPGSWRPSSDFGTIGDSRWDRVGKEDLDSLALAARLADAIQRQEEQSYIMAVAGHDLRQPLQVILMALDRLASRLTPADKLYADIALSEIAHLSRGLNDLALASNLAPGALSPPLLAPLSVKDTFDEIARSWRFHAEAKGLRIVTRTRQSAILSNRDLVCAVLRNLVGNAIKYTDAGGIFINCRKRAGEIRIEVWDTGQGIETSQLGAIMLPYYQADQSRDGLGLGLVIAKIAADRLGARIEVATRVGAGSRFTLCLPSA